MFIIGLTLYSCTDDDIAESQLVEPTFVVTKSLDNPNLYYFENTTPNKEAYYSFWQFTENGSRVIDRPGLIEYEYTEVGDFDNMVTLTLVDVNKSLHSSIVVPSSVEEIIIPPVDTANLLLNGDLEAGGGDDFDNWGKYNGAGNMTEESTDVRSGTRALKVDNPEADPDNAWKVQFVSDPATTTVGETYTLSFWAKGDPVIVKLSTKPDNTAQYGPEFNVTSEWTQFSWTIIANEPATNLSLDMATSAGTFVIDDIALVAGDTPLSDDTPTVENLVVNGDYELGSGDDFDNWGKYNGADNMTEETTEVHSGSRGVKVTNAAEAQVWEVQLVSDPITTEVGAEYTISLWVKGDPVTIRVSTKPDGTAQYGPDYTVTSDWAQHTWTITANEPETNISFDMGLSAGTFYVDDVVVVKN